MFRSFLFFFSPWFFLSSPACDSEWGRRLRWARVSRTDANRQTWVNVVKEKDVASSDLANGLNQ